MATLELSLDETNAAPVRRKRRLGALFWVAIGWMVLVFAVAIYEVADDLIQKVWFIRE